MKRRLKRRIFIHQGDKCDSVAEHSPMKRRLKLSLLQQIGIQLMVAEHSPMKRRLKLDTIGAWFQGQSPVAEHSPMKRRLKPNAVAAIGRFFRALLSTLR